MKGKCIALFAISVAACGVGPQTEKILAGETARSMGIKHYEVERVGTKRIIHVVAAKGPGGVEKDHPIGALTLRPLEVGETAFDEFVLTKEFLRRFPYVAVSWNNGFVDRHFSTFTGPERPGYDCPTPFEPPTLPVVTAYQAALTDPALAPVLWELELVLEPRQPENFVENGEVGFQQEFAGYCPWGNSSTGHRVVVLTDPAGYEYFSCSSYMGMQSIYNRKDPNLRCDTERFCYGGSVGNGTDPPGNPGGTCCNGNNCGNPNPGGLSTQPDCNTQPMSANGCKSTSGPNCYCQPNGCSQENIGMCLNNCEEYDGNCCIQ